jgi:hypothetical protein
MQIDNRMKPGGNQTISRRQFSSQCYHSLTQFLRRASRFIAETAVNRDQETAVQATEKQYLGKILDVSGSNE